VAQSGATSSGANFVEAARAPNAPRAIGEVTSQKPRIMSAGWIRSFVFEFAAYCVNG
jgi:hypothetical protein